MIISSRLPRLLALGTLAVSTAVCSEGPKPPVSVSASSVTTQSAVVNTSVATPPRVKVMDEDGNGVPNVPVLFAVTVGDGIAGGATQTTNGDGEASAGAWTLGTAVGTNRLIATVEGLVGSPVTFEATGTHGAATAISVYAGNIQRAVTGTPVSVRPSVRVVDAFGNPVPGLSVGFAVEFGGGSITGATSTTDGSGVATVGSWTLGEVGGNTLIATIVGNSALTVTVVATAVPPPVPERIEVVAGDLQAVVGGGPVSTAPSVRVTSNEGFPVAGAQVSFAVGLGGGSVTGGSRTTDAQGVATVGGWTLGATMDFNTLTVTVPGSAAPPVTISASSCGTGGPGYKLSLCFTSQMTAAQKDAFISAATRWESIITGDASDVQVSTPILAAQCGDGSYSLASGTMVDDLLIFASVTNIDGPRGILGSAGPCFLRRAGAAFAVGDLSAIGQMRFDVADVAELERTGALNAVILHEMGHVLGIGALWSTFGLVVDPSTSTQPKDTYFSGARAISAFNSVGGTTYGGSKVPVENSFGPGTINSHWRESVLRTELMTGFLDPNGPNPLSIVTVQSLADLGYKVNPDGAETFSLAAPPTGSPSPSALAPLVLLNDLYTGPVRVIDRQGRITRIR